jgi:hypothetical protein
MVASELVGHSKKSDDITRVFELLRETEEAVLNNGNCWYLKPGAQLLVEQESAHLSWEGIVELDRGWAQPASSTAKIVKVMDSNGNARVLKSACSIGHPLFHRGNDLTQALLMGTEQAIGRMQLEEGEEALHLGVGILSINGGEFGDLRSYKLGDLLSEGEQLVSVMRALDSSNTLALKAFNLSRNDLGVNGNHDQLMRDYLDMAKKGARMKVGDLPEELAKSRKGIEVFRDFATGMSVKAFAEESWESSPLARDFINKVQVLLENDSELVDLVEKLEPVRTHGDVRGLNYIDGCLIDPLALLTHTDMTYGTGSDSITHEPWSTGLPHYAMAFQLCELLAIGYEDILWRVVNETGGQYHPGLENADWNDNSNVHVRLLKLCVGIKAIETARLTTFGWDDENLDPKVKEYFKFTVERFPRVANDLISKLVD